MLGEIVFCFKDCSNQLWKKVATGGIKQFQYIETIKILIETNNWDVKKNYRNKLENVKTSL